MDDLALNQPSAFSVAMPLAIVHAAKPSRPSQGGFPATQGWRTSFISLHCMPPTPLATKCKTLQRIRKMRATPCEHATNALQPRAPLPCNESAAGRNRIRHTRRGGRVDRCHQQRQEEHNRCERSNRRPQEGTAIPVHDWTRVGAGIFHDFHHGWIEEIARVKSRSSPRRLLCLARAVRGRFRPRCADLAGSGRRFSFSGTDDTADSLKC